MNGIYKAIKSNSAGVKRLDAIRRSLERDGLAVSVIEGEHTIKMFAHGRPKQRRARTQTYSVVDLPPVPTLEQCTRRLKEAREALKSNRHGFSENIRYQFAGLLDPGSPSITYVWRQMIDKAASRERRRVIGKAVAKIIKRYGTRTPYRFTKQDYSELDAACGQKVRRESQLPAEYKERWPAGHRRNGDTGYLAFIVSYYAGGRFNRPNYQNTDEPDVYDWREKARREELEQYRATLLCQLPPQTERREENTVHVYLRVAADVEYYAEMVRLLTEKSDLRSCLGSRSEAA